MIQNICYFGTFPPYQGGIAQHAATMVNALRRSGFHVTTVSWASQYPRWLYRGHAPSAADKLKAHPEADFAVRWWSPWDWWRVGRRARSSTGLITPWVTPFHALAVVLSAVAARPTPTILVVHNVETHEWFPMRKLLTRLAFRSVSFIIVHSTAVAEQVVEIEPSTPLVQAPMPALLDIQPTPLPPHEPLRLLMVGYVRPYKGLEVALDAVQVLVEKGGQVVLTVAGEFWDPSAGQAARWVAERGLQGVVDLRPGYLQDRDLEEALSKHHLVLLPYLTASQSAITPLAHAARRPVIASNLPGLSEQVEDGVDGMVFEAGSARALADAIQSASNRLDALSKGAGSRPHGAEGIVESLAALLGPQAGIRGA